MVSCFFDEIKKQGLIVGECYYVYFFVDEVMVCKVGVRYGLLVILIVKV